MITLFLLLVPLLVVPYIGTWIETGLEVPPELRVDVVPYIGTWIETIMLR